MTIDYEYLYQLEQSIVVINDEKLLKLTIIVPKSEMVKNILSLTKHFIDNTETLSSTRISDPFQWR